MDAKPIIMDDVDAVKVDQKYLSDLTIQRLRNELLVTQRELTSKDARIKELEQWKNAALELAPDLEKDGVEEFAGHIVDWDTIIDHCASAWKTPHGYSQSPLELISRIINERDDALVKLKSLEGK